jgi:hypothetical protein
VFRVRFVPALCLPHRGRASPYARARAGRQRSWLVSQALTFRVLQSSHPFLDKRILRVSGGAEADHVV